MTKKICVLLVLLVCFSCNLVFAEGIVAAISDQARINGATITLGDLAQITGGDAETVQSLRQLNLGAAPIPGSSFVLTKEVLTMRLAAAAGADFDSITWQIPDNVTVIGNSQSVSGQVLVNKAITAIKEQIGPNVSSSDLVITSVGRVSDVVAPLGDMMLSTSLPYGVRYNTPTTVNVAVSVNNREFSKIGLRFDVKLYEQVAVAARSVEAHEIFTDDSLRYERMNTGRLPAGFITDKNKIMGLMSRRLLTPGMVVTDSMVNKPMAVKRGSFVTLVAYAGSMEVTSNGQAMQDGVEGQLIRVLNINSRKAVFGRIIDASTVQVMPF